jgi:hypothetical protein
VLEATITGIPARPSARQMFSPPSTITGGRAPLKRPGSSSLADSIGGKRTPPTSPAPCSVRLNRTDLLRELLNRHSHRAVPSALFRHYARLNAAKRRAPFGSSGRIE